MKYLFAVLLLLIPGLASATVLTPATCNTAGLSAMFTAGAAGGFVFDLTGCATITAHGLTVPANSTILLSKTAWTVDTSTPAMTFGGNNVVINGTTPTAAVISPANGVSVSGTGIINAAGTTGWKVSGITLDGNQANNSSTPPYFGIAMQCPSNSIFTNNIVQNIDGPGYQDNYCQATGESNNLVDNNSFISTGQKNSNSAAINIWYDAGGAFVSDGWQISNNLVQNKTPAQGTGGINVQDVFTWVSYPNSTMTNTHILNNEVFFGCPGQSCEGIQVQPTGLGEFIYGTQIIGNYVEGGNPVPGVNTGEEGISVVSTFQRGSMVINNTVTDCGGASIEGTTQADLINDNSISNSSNMLITTGDTESVLCNTTSGSAVLSSCTTDPREFFTSGSSTGGPDVIRVVNGYSGSLPADVTVTAITSNSITVNQPMTANNTATKVLFDFYGITIENNKFKGCGTSSGGFLACLAVIPCGSANCAAIYGTHIMGNHFTSVGASAIDIQYNGVGSILDSVVQNNVVDGGPLIVGGQAIKVTGSNTMVDGNVVNDWLGSGAGTAFGNLNNCTNCIVKSAMGTNNTAGLGITSTGSGTVLCTTSGTAPAPQVCK